jgi:hypothetical protein
MWFLGIVAALSLPFWLPGEWVMARAWLSVPAVVWSIKLFELHRGRVNDPAMLATRGLAAMWFLIPPDTRPSSSELDASNTRRAGRTRILRSLLKAPAFLGMLAMATADPSLHHIPGVGTLLGLLLVYVLISGIADLVSGLAMQSGHWIAESFNSPLLARSPRDFWGKRWNLFVHTVALRHLFIPLRGLRRPALAAGVIFLASGLLHEYLVVAAAGWRPVHLGWMMAYFMLHGLAVAAELLTRRRLPRLPRPLAVLAHLVWMVATGPLFLTPMDEAFSYTTWRLW